MAGYRESEELEMTRVEKLLAFGLVVFLLIGMLWVLDRTEELIPAPVMAAGEGRQIGTIPSTETPISDELGIPALRKQVEAQQRVAANRDAGLNRRTTVFRDAERTYAFRREEYRTALEAGRPAAGMTPAYQAARAEYLVAMAEWKRARTAAGLAHGHVAGLQNRLNDLTTRAWSIFNRRSRARDVWLFVFRFGYAAALIALAWAAWLRGRAARWRYLSLLTAFLAAAVVQLLFLLFRYCWELMADVAQLGVSVLGTTACVVALVALKRYLFSPERVARARLAAHACPHCSTPFTAGQAHCWDCGRALLEPCPACGAPHLRFAPYCGACGRAVPLPEPHRDGA